jgi:hypothetical protein
VHAAEEADGGHVQARVAERDRLDRQAVFGARDGSMLDQRASLRDEASQIVDLVRRGPGRQAVVASQAPGARSGGRRLRPRQSANHSSNPTTRAAPSTGKGGTG